MSRLARWIYRDMLDVYYDTETPLPSDLDLLCDTLGVESDDERRIVERILRLKFEPRDDGYHHSVCDRVIEEYRARVETAKANGKKAAATRGKGRDYMAKPGILYALRINSDTVKIGITANLKSRLNQLRSKYGKQCVIIHSVQVAHMGDAEAAILAAYEQTRSGEELPVTSNAQKTLMSHMDRLSVAGGSHTKSHDDSPTNQEPITNNQKPKDLNPLVEPIGPTDLFPLPAEHETGEVVQPVSNLADDVRKVFDHWRRVMASPRSTLDARRRGAIERQLKAFTVDELCRAVDGCSMTPHNMGLNDRQTKFNDIELICRSASNVERFMATAASPPPQQAGRPLNKQEQLEVNNLAVAARVSERLRREMEQHENECQ